MNHKGLIFLIVIVGFWFAYQHHKIRQRQMRMMPQRMGGSGSTSSLSSAYGQFGNFATRGSCSPGSGVPASQPNLATTYAIAGTYGIGYTAPSGSVKKAGQ